MFSSLVYDNLILTLFLLSSHIEIKFDTVQEAEECLLQLDGTLTDFKASRSLPGERKSGCLMYLENYSAKINLY